MNSMKSSFELDILKTFDRALRFEEGKKYEEAYIEFLNCIRMISSFLERNLNFVNPKFKQEQLFKVFKMCLNRIEHLYGKIPKESLQKFFENKDSQNRTNLYSSMIMSPQSTQPPQSYQVNSNHTVDPMRKPKSLPSELSPTTRTPNRVISHQMGNTSPTMFYPSPIAGGPRLSVFSPTHPDRPKSWRSPSEGGNYGKDEIYKFVIPPPPVSNNELQAYKRRFRTLDTNNDQRVSKHEFSIGLGLLGINPFSDILFPGFLGLSKAKLKEESFDCVQFEKGLHILYHGSKEEMFNFSNTIFDPDGLEYIPEDVFGSVFRIAFQLVEYLKSENLFDENNTRNEEMTSTVIWGLFKKFGGDERGIITKENFVNHSGTLLFRELGLRDLLLRGNNNSSNIFCKSNGGVGSSNGEKMPIRTYRNRIGSPTCFGEKHFNLVLQMMTGISVVVDMFSAVEKFSLRDFSTTVNFNLPNAPWDRQKTIKFISHCPLVFKRIRRMVGVCISEKEFRHSFGIEQVIGSLLSGSLTTLTSTVSAGKSGNFFFSTYNGVFICKTVSQGEVEHLLHTLQSYVEYLEEMGNSFLTRIIGLYTLIDNSGTEKHFIVMNNVFQTSNKMDVIYDLKGSTFGRTNKGGDGPKKDLDLTNTGEVVMIGEEMRPYVLGILRSDSEFLRKNNIIDYSLLLGIHKVKNRKNTSIATIGGGGNNNNNLTGGVDEFGLKVGGSSHFNYVRKDGGILSISGDKIYYLGVIDHLIHYGFKKNMESVVKRFWYGKEEEISVVEPDQYSKRFISFMEKVFV